MKGPGLVHLAKMSELHWFNLNDTPIDDAGLACLPELKGLTIVGLAATKITDAGLKTLTRFPQLVDLALARTQASGTGLAHLAVMTKLQRLELAGTQTGRRRPRPSVHISKTGMARHQRDGDWRRGARTPAKSCGTSGAASQEDQGHRPRPLKAP